MKRKRYVHGWKGWIQCVYGKEESGPWAFIEPCSLKQAEAIRRNKQKSTQKDYRIYELVDITDSMIRISP